MGVRAAASLNVSISMSRLPPSSLKSSLVHPGTKLSSIKLPFVNKAKVAKDNRLQMQVEIMLFFTLKRTSLLGPSVAFTLLCT